MTSIHIPQMENVLAMPLKGLHAQWQFNNRVLIGYIQSHFNQALFELGFCGMDEKGKESILNTQSSQDPIHQYRDFIWVTAMGKQKYSPKENPVTFLSDFYRIIRKASGYIRERGGMFVVSTGASKEVKPIDGVLSHEWSTTIELDNESDQKIIKRFSKADEHLNICMENHLRFNPDNYHERVRGFIQQNDLIWKDEVIKEFYFSRCGAERVTDAADKYYLLRRFAIQELAFKILSAAQMISQDSLQKHALEYQEKGKNCLSEIENEKMMNEATPEKVLESVDSDEEFEAPDI